MNESLQQQQQTYNVISCYAQPILSHSTDLKHFHGQEKALLSPNCNKWIDLIQIGIWVPHTEIISTKTANLS